jgi:hypothetical protein
MRIKNLLFVIFMALAINMMGQVPLYWFIDTPEPGDISLAPNTVYFTEGAKSCEMTLHTTNVPYFKSDNFAVNMGATYTFSLDVLDNDSRGRLKIYADFYDIEGNDIYGEAPVYSVDDPDWQTISWTAVVPDQAVWGYVWIKFYEQDNFTDEAVIYVDNASFVESLGSNLVVNGGYEQWEALAMDNAYCVSETSIDIRFNSNVETIDVNDFTLGGTASITFSNAAIDPGDATLVHLTGASQNMVFDLTVDELTMATKDASIQLYAGMTPIAYTNSANPDGVIQDEITATFQAIVSANDEYNNIWVHDAAGAYNGVMVFSFSLQEDVAVGDEIIFSAQRELYFDLTELASPYLIETVSTGNPTYDPSVIMGTDINITLPSGSETAEKWEGQLVTIQNATILEYNDEDYFYLCSDDNGATQFKISDNVDYQLSNIALTVGEVYNITGVVDFSFGEYRINPRTADDATNTTGIFENIDANIEIYPNPASEKVSITIDREASSFMVSDLSGSIIFEEEALQADKVNTFSIAELPAGIYFITITTHSGRATSKLIKW